MKLKKMNAAVMAGLMAVGTLAVSGQAMADEEKTVITVWFKDRHDATYVQSVADKYNETNTDNIYM